MVHLAKMGSCLRARRRHFSVAQSTKSWISVTATTSKVMVRCPEIPISTSTSLKWPTPCDRMVSDLHLGRYPTRRRSEEHTSELQSLMRTSYAVFCLKKKN